MPPPAAPGAWLPQHFSCDDPRCGKLLCRPAVLTCGHCVCHPTCLDSGSSGAAGCVCPACGMKSPQPPAVCKQLGDLLLELFPAETRQREQEVQEAVAAAREAAAGAAPAHQQAAGDEERAAPHTPRTLAAPSESGAPASAAGAEGEAAGGEQQALSPSLEAALRRRQAAGGPTAGLADRLEANLRKLTAGEGYVHHGVGCDACGQYPIQGQRWRCRDCPEAVGFDLCQLCMERGVSDIVGRCVGLGVSAERACRPALLPSQ